MNCPYCNSTNLTKKGFRIKPNVGKEQVYQCKDCWHYTSQPVDDKLGNIPTTLVLHLTQEQAITLYTRCKDKNYEAYIIKNIFRKH